MNYFAITSLIGAVSGCFLSLLMFLKSKGRVINMLWGSFCFMTIFWGIGSFAYSTVQNKQLAFFWLKIAHIGVITTPTIYAHFVHKYLMLGRKKLQVSLYAVAILFLYLTFFHSKLFLGDMKVIFDDIYWHDWQKTRSLYYLVFYIGFYWILLGYSFLLLVQKFIHSKGLIRNQIKYFLLGSVVGWLGAHGIFPVCFGAKIYPFSNIFIAIYPLIFGYAIIRYRLMDITLAITRTGIFVAVYSIVLGIPFALAFGWREHLEAILGANWWMGPLVSSTVLATSGPFIYLAVEKRAEKRLFQEQIRYQNTLRQASIGMGRIKDLNRLVTLIVHIVTRTVRLEHSIIYLNDNKQNKFFLAARKGRLIRFQPLGSIEADAEIVKQLMAHKTPIVFEEIKQRTQDDSDLKLARLEAELIALNAALVVPSFIDDNLFAIIILGEKVNNEIYSQSDLAVFQILANQAALAIENAQFYEDMKKTTEQLFKAEKMATIGTMADGLSHQINNRLHALGFIAGDVLDTLGLKKDLLESSPEIKAIAEEVEHALKRIQDNVTQGGEIVQGLLKYSRKGPEGFSQVDFDQLVDAAIEMTQFKIKPGEIEIIRNYPKDLPKIRGNFTQLQEVFFNVIDNAYDSMVERRNELREEGYKPTILVTAENGFKELNITLQDNGMGIKEENVEKLFTPFFTTKLSSKKGTGLGLYVIRRLIEENHGGRVKYFSEFRRGTNVHISLPVSLVDKE